MFNLDPSQWQSEVTNLYAYLPCLPACLLLASVRICWAMIRLLGEACTKVLQAGLSLEHPVSLQGPQHINRFVQHAHLELACP